MNKVINLSNTTRGQAQLMDVLNQLMEKTNLNVNQLSKNTGLANTTVKRICTDPACNPTLTSITKIAAFFGVTPTQLMGTEPLSENAAGYHPYFEAWHKVPLLHLNETVDWPNNSETIQNTEEARHVMTDIDINDRAFAVIVKDETLEPRFSEGTVLIFDPTKTPKNKDFVVLLLGDKSLPQFRQVMIDGPDQYVKIINPEFSDGSLSLLVKNKFTFLGVLIQAKSNYL